MEKIEIQINKEQNLELEKLTISEKMEKLGYDCFKRDLMMRTLIMTVLFSPILVIEFTLSFFAMSLGLGFCLALLSTNVYDTVTSTVGRILMSKNCDLYSKTTRKKDEIRKKLCQELNTITEFKSSMDIEKFFEDDKTFHEYLVQKKELLHEASKKELEIPIWCDSLNEATRYSIIINGKKFEIGDKLEEIKNIQLNTKEETIDFIEEEKQKVEQVFDDSVLELEDSQRDYANQRLLLILKYRQLQMQTIQVADMVAEEIDCLEQEKAAIEHSDIQNPYLFYSRKK